MNVIRLDHKALAYFLEQEGDEFKLELRAAILNTAIEHSLKNVFSDDLREKIDERVQKVADEWIKENGIERTYGGYWNGHKVEIKPELKEMIHDQIKAEMKKYVELQTDSSLLTGYVDKAVETLKAELDYRLSSQVEYHLKTRVRNAIKDLVDSVASEVLGEK